MKCKKCAKCCTEKTVCLSDQDIAIISAQYSFPFFRVRNTGVKLMNWKEHNSRYICVFLSPMTKHCEIYNIRPKVCREYYCDA